MIYLLDKPLNWTSFDLVKKVRRITGEKKVGHAGTLDPLATGLMIVATGSDTKKLHKLTGLDKTYIAEILLGRITETLDQEGKILQEVQDEIQISKSKIIKSLIKLEGIHQLSVPAYSAVKINGVPLYRYARENRLDEIKIPIRLMRVNNTKLLSVSKTIDGKMIVEIEMSVASGVYIRSLAKYFGELLNVPAMLWNLCRVKIGDYSIDQIISLDNL